MSTENTPCWQTLPNAPVPGQLIGAITDIPDGGAKFLDFGPPEACFRLLLLRSGNAAFAYLNSCPHFGVPLAAKESQLILKAHETVSCNVHYARFRWYDGYCERGDCEGESLIPVPLDTTGGVIRIAGQRDGLSV